VLTLWTRLARHAKIVMVSQRMDWSTRMPSVSSTTWSWAWRRSPS